MRAALPPPSPPGRLLTTVLLATALLGVASAVRAQAPVRPTLTSPAFDTLLNAQLDKVRKLDNETLVEELRLRVEQVASRGSAVASASMGPRVRAFESTWLTRVQGQACERGVLKAGINWRQVALSSVAESLQAQKLPANEQDRAVLSALALRTVEAGGPKMCRWRSLDEVR